MGSGGVGWVHQRGIPIRERKEPRSDTMGERSHYDSIGKVNVRDDISCNQEDGDEDVSFLFAMSRMTFLARKTKIFQENLSLYTSRVSYVHCPSLKIYSRFPVDVLKDLLFNSFEFHSILR